MSNDSSTGGYLVPDPITPVPSPDIQFLDLMNDLIEGVTGIPGNMIRPRWQEEPPLIPSITTDWVAIGTTQVTGDDDPYILHVGRAYDVDGNEVPYIGHDEMTDNEELRVLASFYGPNCQKLAEQFRRGISIQQNWEQLHAAGISERSVGPAITLPEEVNDRWYRRCDVEITVVREVFQVFPIRNIINAEGTFHGDGSKPDVSENWNTENV